MTPNNETTIKLRQVLTRCRCQIQSATWQTTGFCTQTSTNLWMTRKLNHTQQDDNNNIKKKCSTSGHTDIGISLSNAHCFSERQQVYFQVKFLISRCRPDLPGGRILSRSRMRADARSLMMYWRRTCLNTERKGAPSSVFRKGSFSHRSAGQSEFSTSESE